MKVNRIFLFISIFNVMSIVSGQELKLENSLLWEISGKQIKTSYLFGTMHVQDNKVFENEQQIKNYIDRCDAFAAEILFDEINQQEMQKLIAMKKHTLKDLLSEEDYKLLDEHVKSKLGVSVIFFNKLKPFFLSTQLMQADFAKEKHVAMDVYYSEYARSRGKQLFGLEKVTEQIKNIDKISLENQAKFLMNTIKDTSKAKMEEVLTAYMNKDINKLHYLTYKDESLPKEFSKYLIEKRNIKMAKNIIKISKTHSCFYAVGAGHLGGEIGIINLLRQKGYTVKPVIMAE